MQTTPSPTRYIATGLAPSIAAQGLLKSWVAKQAGIKPWTLTRILNGERTAEEEIARRLATVLRMDFGMLFEHSDDAQKAS
jgi:DNA-binding XRE family transcriptional regulator